MEPATSSVRNGILQALGVVIAVVVGSLLLWAICSDIGDAYTDWLNQPTH